MQSRLKDYDNFAIQLHRLIDDKETERSDRARAAITCFAIAIQHHHSIILLTNINYHASSMALVRPLYEAYVRGLWLSTCSSDAEAKRIAVGEKFSKINISKLITEIEEVELYKIHRIFSGIKNESWKVLCDYTHTGVLNIQRWNRSNMIEPNYTKDEIIEMLNFAEYFGAWATLGIADLSIDKSISNAVLSAMQGRLIIPKI